MIGRAAPADEAAARRWYTNWALAGSRDNGTFRYVPLKSVSRDAPRPPAASEAGTGKPEQTPEIFPDPRKPASK